MQHLKMQQAGKITQTDYMGLQVKKKLRSILEVQSKCSHIMHSIHGELHLGKAFKELYWAPRGQKLWQVRRQTSWDVMLTTSFRYYLILFVSILKKVV